MCSSLRMRRVELSLLLGDERYVVFVCVHVDEVQRAACQSSSGSTPWCKQEALGLHETPPKPEGWEINDLDTGEIFADAINMRGVALYRGHRRFTGTALMVSMPHRVGCCVLAALACVCVCVLTKAL